MQLKNVGVFLLLLAILLVTSILNYRFMSADNIESLIRWTSLFGFCAIGVAFVIITGGIDLSIGSLIALSGVLLILLIDPHYVDTDQRIVVLDIERNAAPGGRSSVELLLPKDIMSVSKDDVFKFTDRRGALAQGTVLSVRSDADSIRTLLREPDVTIDRGTELMVSKFMHRPVWLAVVLVLLISVAIGALHGFLITKIHLQPFVVTLCGFLIYRGLARELVKEQPIGFGLALSDAKQLFKGHLAIGDQNVQLPIPFVSYIGNGNWSMHRWDFNANTYLLDADGRRQLLPFVEWVDIPITGFYLLITAVLAWFLINRTVFGRYLLALGNNERAAKFSGIDTDKIAILAYVICSGLAGFTGILFAFDLNGVEPSSTGNVYELYAIAAAVIGGCSLRGGSGSILGVIIGTAVMRSLFLAIGSLGIRKSWEYTVIGIALLLAVLTDELLRIANERRLFRQQSRLAEQASTNKAESLAQ